MKLFVLSLFTILLGSGPIASACQQTEAQVIGTVLQSQSVDNFCLLSVKLTYAAPHWDCPLQVRVGEVVGFSINAETWGCPADGSEISGVLWNGGNGSFLER